MCYRPSAAIRSLQSGLGHDHGQGTASLTPSDTPAPPAGPWIRCDRVIEVRESLRVRPRLRVSFGAPRRRYYATDTRKNPPDPVGIVAAWPQSSETGRDGRRRLTHQRHRTNAGRTQACRPFSSRGLSPNRSGRNGKVSSDHRFAGREVARAAGKHLGRLAGICPPSGWLWNKTTSFDR
jgi:hypothetical protein